MLRIPDKRSILERALKLADVINLPINTRWGFRWIPTADLNSYLVLIEKTHPEEDVISFVLNYLKEGDIFFDIGTHHGLYTLIAAKRVGKTGMVVSFEPSPRERAKLIRNISVNRYRDIVKVEPCAVTDRTGEVELLLAPTFHSGLNSLRPINAPVHPTAILKVQSTTIDSYVRKHEINRLNLIKIDAEGAELPILRGSEYVLEHLMPVWIMEISTTRTAPWGYSPADILSFMRDRGYDWYKPHDGMLVPFGKGLEPSIEENLIAIPKPS